MMDPQHRIAAMTVNRLETERDALKRENRRLRVFVEAWLALPYWWLQPPPPAHMTPDESANLRAFRSLSQTFRKEARAALDAERPGDAGEPT